MPRSVLFTKGLPESVLETLPIINLPLLGEWDLFCLCVCPLGWLRATEVSCGFSLPEIKLTLAQAPPLPEPRLPAFPLAVFGLFTDFFFFFFKLTLASWPEL